VRFAGEVQHGFHHQRPENRKRKHPLAARRNLADQAAWLKKINDF
jgi:hypothetical protein